MPVYPQTRTFMGGQYVNGATLNAQATSFSDLILSPTIGKFIRTADVATIPVLTSSVGSPVGVAIPWEVSVLNRDFIWNKNTKTATPTAVLYLTTTTARFTFVGVISSLLPMGIGDRVSTSGFSLASYNFTNGIVIATNSTNSTIDVQLPSGTFTNPFSGTIGTMSAENAQYIGIKTSGVYRVWGSMGWAFAAGAGTRQADIVSTTTFGSSNALRSRYTSAFDHTNVQIIQVPTAVDTYSNISWIRMLAYNFGGPAGTTTPDLNAQPNSLSIEWVTS